MTLLGLTDVGSHSQGLGECKMTVGLLAHSCRPFEYCLCSYQVALKMAKSTQDWMNHYFGLNFLALTATKYMSGSMEHSDQVNQLQWSAHVRTDRQATMLLELDTFGKLNM